MPSLMLQAAGWAKARNEPRSESRNEVRLTGSPADEGRMPDGSADWGLAATTPAQATLMQTRACLSRVLLSKTPSPSPQILTQGSQGSFQLREDRLQITSELCIFESHFFIFIFDFE